LIKQYVKFSLKIKVLWNTFGDCKNFGQLKGHKNAILEIDWYEDILYSAGADKKAIVWDTQTGECIKRYSAHSLVVNSINSTKTSTLFVTGSDDKTAKIWDTRSSSTVSCFDCTYPVTSVCFSKGGEHVFTGGKIINKSQGIDNEIKVWDIKKQKILRTLPGHKDTVTGLSISPDGNFLLSNSMDNTLRMWDVRPMVKGDRCKNMFYGFQQNIDKNLLRCSWSPDNDKVTCGSSDSPTNVFIWSTDSEENKILYKLPGHLSTVNEVVFHPFEPIVLSCSSDKTLYLGELL
jgi:Prp8 binding protein